MESTLIIWEEVPEDTSLYLIPNALLEANKDWNDLLNLAHNKIINCDESNPGLQFLNAALLDSKYVNDDSMFDNGMTNIDGKWVKTHTATPKEHRCVFHQYKISKKEPIVGVNITRVIFSGFHL